MGKTSKRSRHTGRYSLMKRLALENGKLLESRDGTRYRRLHGMIFRVPTNQPLMEGLKHED